MEELVKYIAKSLVDSPDEVSTNVKEDNRTVTVELIVGDDDKGKVIGKQGRIAKAIRTVVKAASAKDKKKYLVEII